ncbi:mitochondrial import inner membrane translocase subunit Tim21 isoform X2 [Drosophila grimshawi]|uniref:mitochondrial import inner membrane translocase subunit Tim21 isoform X2 n=1 Tax=Drosophila grimshawi TaxID=7222 RepID=UPI000C86E568|nr:mitochondrial import inner membrane translocase subunit Tim21 isoform X2 [Drosophila grimshawi]
MAQSILLRSLMLHRRTVLLPSNGGRLRCLAALHLSGRVGQQMRSGGKALQESQGGDSNVSTDVRPIGEKIKENTKTASYTAIILAGLGVTGIMFYAIFRELFSKESSCNIYSKALARVVDDPRVQDAIGAPIKGFGETSRRGRRQHVAHSSFDRHGVPHMRMQFYVQGLRNKATVQLESRRDSNGKQQFRYLFVQLDHYPRTTIILEDNRAYDPKPASSALSPSSADSPFGSLALMSNNRDK